MSSLQRLVGTVLGGYRLERPIGEGGMGAIFEATQLSLSRRVAIKVLKPAFEQDEDRIKRFEVETEAIARLQHPHIVSVLDAGRTEDGTLFLAMELLEGKTIRQTMKAGPIAWPRALAIAEGVSSALVAAHAAGVIHRDLKAENVILWEKAGRPDFVKVLDFGVCKLTSQVQAPQVTGTGFVAGTPGCMSPEQILGKSDDPRSDLYSLGVLLFEMLTGRAPFVAQNPMELMLRHLNDPAPRVSELLAQQGVDVPPAVDALVAGLLQKDAALRPPNAAALVEAIHALRDSMAATMPDLRAPVVTPPAGLRLDGTGGLSMTPPVGEAFGSKVVASPAALAAATAGVEAGSAAPSAPSTTAPSIAPSTAPSTAPSIAAAPAPAPSASTTSPTVAAPNGLLAPRAPRRFQRAALIAIGVVALVGGLWGARSYMSFRASVTSNDPEARKHVARAEEAYWELDLRRVMDETELALARDPDAAWAHVLRAQMTLLSFGSLAMADAEMAAALDIANQRARRSMMDESSHLQHVVRTLATLDTAEAIELFREHPEKHRCGDPVERQMFAVKMLSANQSTETVEALFEEVRADGYGELPPAVALGLARSARAAGKLKDARVLLEPQLARTKSALIAEELADLEVSEGNVDAAKKLLEGVVARDRAALRSQLRLAALSREKDAFAPLIAELRHLPAQDPRRIDGLTHIGEQMAALGRLAEADALWRDAFDGATAALLPDVATEIASIVMFFAILSDDFVRGEQWYERVKEWAPRCTNEVTAARTKMFSLAAGFLLSRKKSTQPSEIDFQTLQRAKRDVPLVMQQISFSRAFWTGKFDEAMQATAPMPPCFASTYRGMTQRRRAGAATDPAEVRTLLGEAARHLDETIAPERRAACTAGGNVLPLLQSITVALAYAQRALVAQALDDREAARRAIDGFRAHWPQADADGVNAADIATVEAWLAGAAPRP